MGKGVGKKLLEWCVSRVRLEVDMGFFSEYRGCFEGYSIGVYSVSKYLLNGWASRGLGE